MKILKHKNIKTIQKFVKNDGTVRIMKFEITFLKTVIIKTISTLWFLRIANREDPNDSASLLYTG